MDSGIKEGSVLWSSGFTFFQDVPNQGVKEKAKES